MPTGQFYTFPNLYYKDKLQNLFWDICRFAATGYKQFQYEYSE